MRIVGPNCLGVMVPGCKIKRHVRRRHGAAGQRRFHQPERRALHGDSRLELEGKRRLQRVRFARLDARRRLGRFDQSSRRRSEHQEHCHLHGNHRRCAVVSFRRARSGADQADHRHQARPHRGRRQSRRVAHRFAHRQRRSFAGGVPARRRFARRGDFRIVRHGGSARQTAAPERPAPDHRHQRRRPERPRHGHAHRQRRATRRAHAGNDGGVQRHSSADVEPQQSGGHHWRRQAGALRASRWKSRPKTRTPTACWSSSRRRR